MHKSFMSQLVRPVAAVAIVVASIAIGQPTHSVTKATAAPATVIAYVSSENGHYSHTINTDTKSWGTSVGDFQPSQNNWRCQRMSPILMIFGVGFKVLDLLPDLTSTTDIDELLWPVFQAELSLLEY